MSVKTIEKPAGTRDRPGSEASGSGGRGEVKTALFLIAATSIGFPAFYVHQEI